MRCGASPTISRAIFVVDDAVAGGDGVGEMLVDEVALGHGGGDAALRPGRRSALADRRRGQDRHGARREAQRGEEAGQPAADDDDVVGDAELRVCSRPTP